jgi:hypothetical protein
MSGCGMLPGAISGSLVFAAVEPDHQSIERSDFPIGRRGYERAAVDAHLRQIALLVQELRRELQRAGEGGLAAGAGSQVHAILEAAQRTAGDIEREAQQTARQTREDAVRAAESHTQVLSSAVAGLLARTQSIDAELTELLERVRGVGTRLSADLGAVEREMADLHDAAGGLERSPAINSQPNLPAASDGLSPAEDRPSILASTVSAASAQSQSAEPQASTQTASSQQDADGARLIALNMALNGEPRDQVDRYLAENYTLGDRQELLNEVYAAIGT